MVTFLNGLIEFAENMALHWRDKHRTITEKVNILCSLLGPSLMAFHSFGCVYGLHRFNPRQPTLAGYWLLGGNHTFHGLIIKLAILLFNFWVWISMTLGGVLCAACVITLCPVSIRDCIHLLYISETNPVSESIQKRCVLYRRLQVLAALHIYIQAGALMTKIIMVATDVATQFCAYHENAQDV